MDYIIDLFYVPEIYIGIVNDYTNKTLSNVNDNVSNIKDSFIEFNTISNNIFLNNFMSINICLLILITLTSMNYYYNKYFNNEKYDRLYELCNLKNKENDIINSNYTNNTNNTNDTNNKNTEIPKNNFYVNSLNEIIKENTLGIKMKKNINLDVNKSNNYILLLRVKLNQYIPIVSTKYELYSKTNKYTKFNDFITKDMYMIMGINFIKTDDENDDNYYDIKNIIKKIILNINYLNNISNKEYINEDFIIISITNCNTANDLNITNEISKGFININYEIFNIRDVIIKINRDITIKYTLTLPIQNVYNMLMDTCNNSVFESKLYSIDSNNVEKWNGIPLNDIENW